MFVFPMAGLSNRFTAAGYDVPKYMLPAGDRSLFEHAISGFHLYYESETFLFVTLAGKVEPSFIFEGCERRGLSRQNVAVVELDSPTDGQASTVAQGLEQQRAARDEPITIFNIDSTYRRFEKPAFAASADAAGYLDVFKASGNHWSFVRPKGAEGAEGIAVEVTEKQRISDLCSTGLYHFSRAELFLDSYSASLESSVDGFHGRERYVAPLYNRIIAQGGTVFYRLVDPSRIAFSGTPDEYEGFLSRLPFEYD